MKELRLGDLVKVHDVHYYVPAWPAIDPDTEWRNVESGGVGVVLEISWNRNKAWVLNCDGPLWYAIDDLRRVE